MYGAVLSMLWLHHRSMRYLVAGFHGPTLSSQRVTSPQTRAYCMVLECILHCCRLLLVRRTHRRQRHGRHSDWQKQTTLCLLLFHLLSSRAHDDAQTSGVLLAFIGVTMVILFQAPDLSFLQDQSIVAGLFVAILSAVCAAYDVVFKLVLGADLTDTSTILLLTGLSGLMTLPVWLVGSVVVAHSPFASLYEPFGWPSTADGVGLLFLSGALAVLINICIPLLLCWTSPLETSVGGMLVVPLSGVWDVVFHGTRFSTECVIGPVLVLLGYGVLEYVPHEATSVQVHHKEPSAA